MVAQGSLNTRSLGEVASHDGQGLEHFARRRA
jgi:hypothetical protein